jgi:hypothetical protein
VISRDAGPNENSRAFRLVHILDEFEIHEVIFKKQNNTSNTLPSHQCMVPFEAPYASNKAVPHRAVRLFATAVNWYCTNTNAIPKKIQPPEIRLKSGFIKNYFKISEPQ